jgi:hypothetical protein
MRALAGHPTGWAVVMLYRRESWIRMVDRDMMTNTALARIGRLLRPRLHCSFCNRSAAEVGRLVAGASAHICDECITKCIAVLEQHGGLTPAPRSAH